MYGGKAKEQFKGKTSISVLYNWMDGGWQCHSLVKKAVEAPKFDGEDHKFSFRFVEFELFLRHINGEAKKIIGFKNLELGVSDINLI